MVIEPGQKTDEPIRTRGWTHWHHLFTPRSLWLYATYKRHCRAFDDQPDIAGALAFDVSILIDRSARLSRWHVGHPGRAGVAPQSDNVEQVFYNQALNVLYNYGAKSFAHLRQSVLASEIKSFPVAKDLRLVANTGEASSIAIEQDIYITDPPYADAVEYHEITEFFIAWLRRNPPAPFEDWVWDSRRDLAIKGTGEDFRREMVKAYRAMADHMPANGMQIVMFTHQDASVWGDMAGIFWGAGLQVTAAWYIATETTSELKKGGYVQGTVILVLRKRPGDESTYKDELALEIRQEVARQIETLVGLDQRSRANGRSENLFSDADLQMAGYAAALRVLTRYTHIDGTDMTREALRPRTSGESTIVGELIDLAVQIANEHLVPEGLSPKLWERLAGSERFYLRMLDIEEGGGRKLDNYQNFAKAFRVGSWQPLMASMKPNDARLKSAAELKRNELGESEFGTSLLRGVLYAIYEIGCEVDAEEVMSHLRDQVGGWYQRRADAADLAGWLGRTLERLRADEASAARVLEGLIRNERLGA
jgi:adenine-specific DNA methylase